MLSESDGKILVKLARETIENFFKNHKPLIQETEFRQNRGVFVSIHTYPDHKLRGCIGYPEPILSLGEAVQKASLSSAFHDPRFPPLSEKELKRVVFEVSVLTKPELIKVKKPKEYLRKIKIGKDGLIIEHGFQKGLLLPQVPLQFKPVWDVETFLQHTCLKAGLFFDAWLDPETKIYKFQAQIFKEKKPYGEIIQT
ncbi:MAG: TIGR00296 family protein [Candidatus Latescibacterota bacterium]|nr:MAG: TIGR00296 family protein [Candidatus Latescibacterota bacterium]